MPWGQSIFPLLLVSASGGFTGLFVYDPGPGPGNLLLSVASAPGTDPFGNAYVKGLATYSPGHFAPELGNYVQLTQSTIVFDSNAASSLITFPAQIFMGDTNNATIPPTLTLRSPYGGGSDFAIIQLAGPSPDGSTSPLMVISDTIKAWAPGTAHGTIESWHNFTGSSGITSSTANRYRYTTDNCVEIDVQLVNSNVNVTLGTLPAAYRPNNDRNAPIAVSSGGTTADRLAVSASTGVCTLGGMGSTGVNIGFNVRIPLD